MYRWKRNLSNEWLTDLDPPFEGAEIRLFDGKTFVLNGEWRLTDGKAFYKTTIDTEIAVFAIKEFRYRPPESTEP